MCSFRSKGSLYEIPPTKPWVTYPSFSINSGSQITRSNRSQPSITMRLVKLLAVFTILAALFAVTWPVAVLGRLGRAPPTPKSGPVKHHRSPWLQRPPPPPPPRPHHRHDGLRRHCHIRHHRVNTDCCYRIRWWHSKFQYSTSNVVSVYCIHSFSILDAFGVRRN